MIYWTHVVNFGEILRTQLAKSTFPHLNVGAPGMFSDLLRSVQILKREWCAESNGKLPHLFIPGKTVTLVPEFAVVDLPSAELQPLFLRLQWRTCPWAEPSDVDDDDDDDLLFTIIIIILLSCPLFWRSIPNISILPCFSSF